MPVQTHGQLRLFSSDGHIIASKQTQNRYKNQLIFLRSVFKLFFYVVQFNLSRPACLVIDPAACCPHHYAVPVRAIPGCGSARRPGCTGAVFRLHSCPCIASPLPTVSAASAHTKSCHSCQCHHHKADRPLRSTALPTGVRKRCAGFITDNNGKFTINQSYYFGIKTM